MATTLGYLVSFHAVSQALNISAAAKTLGMSQPALSRQLKRLEEDLGVTLFMRRQRGIALTRDGSKLAETLVPVLSSLTERLQLLRAQGKSVKGRLRIASLTEIGKSFLLPRMVEFSQQYPDVDVDISLLKGAEILAALHEQVIDFGIIVDPPKSGRFAAAKIAVERSLVVTRASNAKMLTTAGDVLAAGFVTYRQDDPLLAAFIQKHFPGVNVGRIKPAFAVNDHKAMIDVLMAFDHFAVMPVHSLTGYLESGSLRNASSFELCSDIWLLRPAKARDTLMSKAVESVLGVKQG